MSLQEKVKLDEARRLSETKLTNQSEQEAIATW